MIKVSKEQIKEIADLLDSGLKCYYNLKTHEVLSIIDFDTNYYADPTDWEDIINELEDNYADYFEFERMTSRESFQVMEDFIDEIQDEALRKRLVWSLNRSHPFRNFKDEIDYNGEYREAWFQFKQAKYIEHVENIIHRYNQLEEFNKNEKN